MIPDLKARGVKVLTTGAAEMGRACGNAHDAIRDGRLWHGDQAQLNKAMAGCEKRSIGTAGAWGLDRRDPETNIAPAVSTILAHYGAMTTRRPSQEKRKVVVRS